MNKKILVKANGFTLIELLVAIGIVMVMMTIGLVIFSQAQKAGRTAKRVEDLRNLQTAIETYKTAKGKYPFVSPQPSPVTNCNVPTWYTACAGWSGNRPQLDSTALGQGYIPGLAPEFMQILPVDPDMDVTNSKSCYMYYSDGIDYKLLDHDIEDYFVNRNEYLNQKNLVDPKRDGGTDENIIDPSLTSPGIWSWAIYSKGAACW